MNRRRFLTAAGVSGATIVGGCLDNGEDEDESLIIGDPEAVTGPYSVGATHGQEGAQFAAWYLDEHTDFERDVEVVLGDTELDPSKAIRVTREMIEEDGIHYCVGTSSSSTGLAISGLFPEYQRIYLGIQASDRLRGEECNFYMYQQYTTSEASINGILPLLEEQDMGNSWYTIAADYAFGQDQETAIRNIAEADDDIEYQGASFTEFGHGDYSSQFASARDGDPDVLFLCHWGGDSATAGLQAIAQGLHQEMHIVIPLFADFAAVQFTPEELQHLWGGITWINQLDNEATNNFVEVFQEENGQLPSENHYMNFRAVLLAAATSRITGTVNPTEMSSALESNTFEELGDALGENLLFNDYPDEHFRPDDHALVKPYYQVRGKGPDDVQVGEWDLFELVGQAGTDHLPEPLDSCSMPHRPS